MLGHAAPEAAVPEIRITVDHRRVAAGDGRASAGRLVAGQSPGRPDYELRDLGPAGYLYKIRDFVQIYIAADQGSLHCRLLAGASESMLPVMLGGHVLATLMLLRGQLVLHASAVEAGGFAYAFVGHSGAGKSTLAALACRSGARLVTDDVLRVEPEGTMATCFRGGSFLRLRPESKALAGAEDGTSAGMSADGRHLVASPPTTADRLPLAGIFVPCRREPADPLARTTLDPKAALLTLLQFPRVLNWTDPQTSAEHFDKLASVVQHVPVHCMDVPWGRPIEEPWIDRFFSLLFDPSPGVLG